MEQQEAKGRGRRLHQFFAIVLVITCFFGYSFDASALLISNGTASSGGSGNSASSATGHYDLPAFVNDNYINAPAYRFSVVDGNGNAMLTSADVFKAAYSKYAGTDYHKLETKYPKTELKSIYKTSTPLNSKAVNNACYIDSNIGLSLPTNTIEMANSWSDNQAFISTLMNKLWGKDTNYLGANNYYLLIEPIYPATLKGQSHALTVTEIAVYGANEFGANTVPPSSGDANSFAWISNYTNKLYPNALRLKKTEAGLFAPAELIDRASFATIIENGYGAMTVSAKALGVESAPAEPPEILQWTYEQSGAEGFMIYVDVNNADTLQIPVWTELAGQDDLVWYDAVYLPRQIDGHWYNWARYVYFSDHNNELGKYNTHFYAFNTDGADVDAGVFAPISTYPKLTNYRVHQTGTGYEGFTVYLKVENASSVYQSTFMTNTAKEDRPYLGENTVTPTAGSYVLDGVEYNYKYSVSFNEFQACYIGGYSSQITMSNVYATRAATISYTFGYNYYGAAEASEDGKGFFIYAKTLNNDTMGFEVDVNGITNYYVGEEGMFGSYNYRAFVPYADFARDNVDEYGTYNIRMFAGNEHTFRIDSDKTTKSINSIHNPTNNDYPADIFQYTPETYTVTYLDENGTALGYQRKLKNADLVLEPPAHTKEGFLFYGWMDVSNGTGAIYWDGDKYTVDADIKLKAQWRVSDGDSLGIAGVARTTIKVGDVFEPMEHLDKFNFFEGAVIGSVDIVYNGVPRDAENKATTSGTGYTVVYDIVFKDHNFGRYSLIVTVLDENAVVSGANGFIRFIAHKYLYTLNENSKWREDPLQSVLEESLAITEPTDDNAVEVWHFSPEDVQEIKKWIQEGKENGVSREEQNAEFGTVFGRCQTKGKYADERRANEDKSAHVEPLVAIIDKKESNEGTEEQENEA